MSHTPEPWNYGEDNDGWYVEVAGNQIAFGLTEANARRIVACVNACAGIPTDDLDAGSVAELAQLAGNKLNALTKQRDELLAAIEPLAELCDQLCRWDRRFDDVLDAVDAAIASVKGQS